MIGQLILLAVNVCRFALVVSIRADNARKQRGGRRSTDLNVTNLKRRQSFYQLQSSSSSNEDDYEDDIDDSSNTTNNNGNGDFIATTVPGTKKNSRSKKKKKTRGRVKIKMEFIENKIRRYTTFSKRKTGIMKKAYELATLTGTQVMLLVASETGHVYTFATRKLQPMITSEAGKALIQTCLNNTSEEDEDVSNDNLNPTDEVEYEEVELFYKTPPSSTSTTLAHNDVIVIDQSIKNLSNKQSNASNEILNNNRTCQQNSTVNIPELQQQQQLLSESPSTDLEATTSSIVREQSRKRFKVDASDSTPKKIIKSEIISTAITTTVQDSSLQPNTIIESSIQNNSTGALTVPCFIVQSPQQTSATTSPYTIDMNFFKSNGMNIVFGSSSSPQSNITPSSNFSTSVGTQTLDNSQQQSVISIPLLLTLNNLLPTSNTTTSH
ncbi:unnamed protein product [Didymodactylos carnosus]|uniref:MADS-box domain-containing protein n=1 Tax=Didymodactylos carnosus TaxID=1234261 RepID=A0A8S2EKS7_9BILA|nr:unnamed protein product [Didymodactylos carnosus]CAF3982674.1 unnamed protein product [Didymodactylos carnosus]